MALAERLPNVRYIPIVSDATAADNWTGRTGFVHAAALADIADMSGMQAYVCGAPIVVDAAKRDFVSERGSARRSLLRRLLYQRCRCSAKLARLSQ